MSIVAFVSTRYNSNRLPVAKGLLETKDMIYNMACPASPVHYQWNPIKTTKATFVVLSQSSLKAFNQFVQVSVLGTIHMMGLAKRVKARILQASTSEIYGDPEAGHGAKLVLLCVCV